MVKLVTGIPRRISQIGIVPRLLVVSLAVVVMAVVVLQTWTLNIVEASETQAAQLHLDINLGVLKEALHQRGTVWTLDESGQLMLDGKAADALDNVVETISRITQGVATVFAGDKRVATTVKRSDGSSALGTRLAAGPARDTVIGRGETYRGISHILGADYFTVYEPLRNPAGRPIGILFVGVSRAEAQAVLRAIIAQSFLAAGVVILVVESMQDRGRLARSG